MGSVVSESSRDRNNPEDVGGISFACTLTSCPLPLKWRLRALVRSLGIPLSDSNLVSSSLTRGILGFLLTETASSIPRPVASFRFLDCVSALVVFLAASSPESANGSSSSTS